jgi:hypothetical protein
MTERKPPNKSWDSWIEELIQRETDKGGFDGLEGKGKPIPGLDAPYDPLWWVKKLMEREKLSVLPLALEVRAKVERGLEEVWRARDEHQVRARVKDINAAIAQANRTTAEGPPTNLSPLDVETVLAEWRRRRPDA